MLGREFGNALALGSQLVERAREAPTRTAEGSAAIAEPASGRISIDCDPAAFSTT
jgi:hypothetical protein